VDEGDADTQGAEVYAGDDGHGGLSEKTITETEGKSIPSSAKLS
jgi:hypothetical protein